MWALCFYLNGVMYLACSQCMLHLKNSAAYLKNTTGWKAQQSKENSRREEKKGSWRNFCVPLGNEATLEIRNSNYVRNGRRLFDISTLCKDGKECQECNTIFSTNCVPLCTFGCLYRCLQHKRLELCESVLEPEYYCFPSKQVFA